LKIKNSKPEGAEQTSLQLERPVTKQSLNIVLSMINKYIAALKELIDIQCAAPPSEPK